LNYTKKVD